MLKIIDSGVISHQSERGAYMPVITPPLADGSFIACQHIGQGLGTPDNHINNMVNYDPIYETGGCGVRLRSFLKGLWTFRMSLLS